MLYPQLEQRISVKFHIHRFGHEESAKYVRHRLKVAGAEGEIFSDEALYLIYKVTNGVPRRINNLCDLCLLEGMGRQAEKVDENVIRQVI